MRVQGKMVVTTMIAYVKDYHGRVPSLVSKRIKEVKTTLVLRDGAPYFAMIQDDGRTVTVLEYPETYLSVQPAATIFAADSNDPLLKAAFERMAEFKTSCPNEVFWESYDTVTKSSNAIMWSYFGEREMTFLHGATPVVTLSRDMCLIRGYWSRAFEKELYQIGAFDLVNEVADL